MPPRDAPWDLFVSYAHRDAAAGRLAELVALIREIQRGLDPARPWHVFFDTDAIRVLDDWERRIGHGLGSAGVMLALASPAYFASEWCRREWAAFREQERHRGEPRDRLGVLYLETDPTFEQADPACDWRRDLKRRQFLDLRGWSDLDAAARHGVTGGLVHRIHGRLEALLSAEARRFGAPYQFPPLPDHYVARPSEEQTLQRHLLGDGSERGVVVSAVFGQGGIGKSTLVSAVVRKPAVLDRFPDGVLWASLGQEPEPLALLGEWARSLGDYDFKPIDVRAASSRLRQLLRDRAALLIVDDAWRVEDVEPFRVGGAGCRLVVTTRRARIADDLGAAWQELGVPSVEQAVALLAARLQRPLGEAERSPAKRLAETLGRLPLALELAAVRVGRGVAWADLQGALDRQIAALEALEDPSARRQGKAKLEASFQLSLRALHAEDEAAWRAFAWLGVLPEDATLTAAMARTLWDLPTEDDADDLLEVLWGEALLQPAPPRRVAGRERRSYRVHDLLHDHARRLLAADRPLTEAHGELLRRYRARARQGRWHTLADDGYVHGRLGWHLAQGDPLELHALLREETADGENGWYAANDRLGQAANFLDDVLRAGRLAATPGLRCRYVLILASLRSLVSNLLPELLAGLVRVDIWPLEQAWAYARYKPDRVDRANALRLLIPLAPAGETRRGLQAEALAEAESIRDEFHRGRALAALVPYLPQELLERALRAAEAVRNELSRGDALAVLAGLLPSDALDRALLAAQGIESESGRSQILVALAPRFPVPLLGPALDAAQAIRSEDDRCRVLAALAPRLPAELIERALRAAEAGLRYNRSEALAILTGHLPEGERQAGVARALRSAQGDLPYYHSRAMAALAPHLPECLLEPAVRGALAITDGKYRGLALAGLAPHLPETLLVQAFHGARTIRTEHDRQDTFERLAGHLTPDLFEQALQEVLAFGHETERSLVLIALAPHLPERLIEPAFRIAGTATFGMNRSRLLIALAPRLPAGLLGEALHAARALGDHAERIRALAALAPHLPAGDGTAALEQALRAAVAIERDEHRRHALETLAPQLPPGLLEEALSIAGAIRSDSDRNPALAALIPHLPAGLLRQVLDTALRVGDEYERCRALAALAPFLAEARRETVLRVALTAAGAIDEHYRSYAVAALAPLLPAALLTEGRRVVQNIADPSDRGRALAALAPQLPESDRPAALGQALRDSQTGPDFYRRECLAALAAHLPPELVEPAFRAALAITSETERPKALAALAPYLPAGLLEEAFHAARTGGDDADRCRGLAGLVPHLPEALRAVAIDEALRAAQTYGAPCLSETLVALADYYPEPYRVEALSRHLARVDSFDRDEDRLRVLTALAPLLPEALLEPAFQAALAIRDESCRTSATVALAPYLPPDILERALQAAEAIRDGVDRGLALLDLALHVPEERCVAVLERADAAFQSAGADFAASHGLTAFLPRLVKTSRTELPRLFIRLLDALGVHTRHRFQQCVPSLIAVIRTLAGDDAPAELAELASAIVDVGRWWP